MKNKNKPKSAPKTKDSNREEVSEEAKEAARAKAAAGRATVSSSSSWTGKLPGSLLQEHCQKQKWEKVTFDCKKIGEGFVITVVLGQKNQKTGEVQHVRLTPPKDLVSPQETPLEARHFAATYALHRVASHKNMKMVLPGAHKELWVKLDEVKKGSVDKDRFYATDPFLAEREHQVKMKQKSASAASNEKQEEIRIGKIVRSAKSNLAKEASPQEGPKYRVRFNNDISMVKDVRARVEKVIRNNGGFELIGKSANECADKKRVLETIKSLGFEKFQAEEALEYANSTSDALEWLLIHVPEDDLPEIFNRGRTIGSSASIQTGDLKVEHVVRELKVFGYDEELIREMLVQFENKFDALAGLTQQLVCGEPSSVPGGGGGGDDDLSLWDEECEGLQALYDNCTVSKYKIIVELKDVKVHLCRGRSYPHTLPGIGLEPKIKAPKYALLDAVKRAGTHAQDYIGDCMLSLLIDWIEENFRDVLKNPSRLSAMSSGITGSLEQLKQLAAKSTRPRSYKLRFISTPAEKLKSDLHYQLENSTRLKKMIVQRQSLPAWAKQQELIQVIKSSQLCLITGETGSGKSTQVGQFILDDMIERDVGNKCNIICTQPRRISAMGLAQRVADERDTKVGDVVGYAIRGETKTSAATMMRFVTVGVLLRMLQTDGGALDNVSHVIVDEVHERSLDAAFLLILLKRLVQRRKSLKIVLMSATVDTTAFQNYFDNKLGMAHIEGRTFPVDNIYLDQIIKQTDFVPPSLQGVVGSDQVGRIILAMKDRLDYGLIAHVVKYAHSHLEDGSIIIFMSGSAEIDSCIQAIQSPDFFALPLHSSLPPQEQRRVFDAPPKGKRKIVVSTNVAETSITIPDAVAVIDSGRVKQTVYDPSSNIVKLVDSYASQAEVTQRRGRAGRVRRGVCYKLYSEGVEKELAPQPSPEIHRTPLEQLYLGVCAMDVGDPDKFLQEALDKPDYESLNTAKDTLVQTGSIDDQGKLTSLGRHIATIPADVRTAKLLILSAAFGVLEKGLTIAAILSLKSPFISPREKRDEAKLAMKNFDTGCGDLDAACNAYEEWTRQKESMPAGKLRAWCSEHFLSTQVLFDIKSGRRQFKEALQEIGFLPYGRNIDAFYDRHCTSVKLVQAVVGAALTPNIAEIVLPEKQFKAVSGGAIEQDPEARSIKFFTNQERIFIHPSSLLFGLNKFDGQYLAFGSKMATTKLFASSITPFGTYGLLFFSNSIAVDPLGNGVVARQWLGLKCWPRVGILVKALQALFNRMLDSKFENPGGKLDNEVINTAIMLIESEGK